MVLRCWGALAEEDALRVFAEVVAVTGTGLPEPREGTVNIHYVTAHGVSRRTGLPVGVLVMALKRLADAAWRSRRVMAAAGVRITAPCDPWPVFRSPDGGALVRLG